jgi:hypothetical protein
MVVNIQSTMSSHPLSKGLKFGLKINFTRFLFVYETDPLTLREERNEVVTFTRTTEYLG